jgi:hypothetical protein
MSLWTRFGRLPGANLAAALVAVLIAVAVAVSFTAALIAWVFAAIGYALYCVARPIGGIDAFAAFAGPLGSAFVIHLVSGLPYRELSALLVAIGLIALMSIDREDGLVPAS